MNLRNIFPISKKEGIELKELLLEINKNNEIIKEKYEKTITFQNAALELTLNKLETVLNDNKSLIKSYGEMDLKLEKYQNNISYLENKNNEANKSINGILNLINKLLFRDLLKNHKKEVDKISNYSAGRLQKIKNR
ncbi:MAG: hypothetical protein ACRC0F_10130 [Cetobacterium sp.]